MGRPKRRQRNKKQSEMMRVSSGFKRKSEHAAEKLQKSQIEITRILEKELDRIFYENPLQGFHLFRPPK